MAGETTDAPTADEYEEQSLLELFDPRGFGWPTRFGLFGLLLLAILPLLRGYGVAVPGLGIVRVNSLLLGNFTGALFFAVFAMSWDVVSGYTGEISFGHGLFFGVGGFTSAILNADFGLGLMMSIPLGMVAAAIAGLLIGVPSLRLQGPYFSLITLVTPIIVLGLFKFAPELTGGATGKFTGTLSVDPAMNYAYAFLLFVFTLGLFLAITRSDAGIVLTAIREDELAVEAAGLNPAKFKLFAFILSGSVGGLAGAMYVHTYLGGIATPSDLLALVISIEVIIAAILGGIGTIVGAAVAGLVLFLFRIYIANINATVPVLGVDIAEIYFFLFLAATFLFLFYIPEGMVPRILRAVRSREESADDGTGGSGGDGGEEQEVAADGAGPGWTEGGSTTLERIVAKFTRELRELTGGGDDR
jgi:branched-chain amino acid transport system permease protein